MAARDDLFGAHASTAPHTLLSDAQRLDWLRLIRSENVGPATFRELINHCGSAAAALDALPELSRRGGRSARIRLCAREDAERELARARKAGAKLVAMGEPGYPPWLAQVETPPPLLYLAGKLELAGRPIVAIVGARNGSASGQKFTRILANELGRAGFVIASGLARGIDAAAHAASLERGTIAVLAGGIDIVYPPEHEDLHAAVGRDGMLISERPPGYGPRGQDFPRRNRIISGVSLGVVVVEAAARSGSLITARLAGEQGREVFAVPGHPLDPRANGTNTLLRNGATFVTSAADVIEALTPLAGLPRAPDDGLAQAPADNVPEPLESIAQTSRERVIEALGTTATDIDEVIRATRLPAREVHVILLELDLAGRLERQGRQLVALI